MKTSNDTLTNTAQSILLMGPPGGGKTTLALQWPRLWVADCDQNLAGPLRWLKHTNKYQPFAYDTIALDDEGKRVEVFNQWKRVLEKTAEAIKSPDIDTLFIDSLTHIDRIVYAWACVEQKTKELEFQQWNMFKNALYKFIMDIRGSGKTLLMSCHENIEYGKKGEIEKYVPTMSTNLKNYFAYMFTDVWRCTIIDAGAGKVKAVVKTHPTAVSDLKNSLLLGNEVEASYDVIKTYIEKVKI